MSEDLYALLGLDMSATPDEVTRAYRALARELHPDVTGDAPDLTEHFKAVTDAYNTLSDPPRRAAYDAELAAARRAATPTGDAARTGSAEWAEAGLGALFDQMFGATSAMHTHVSLSLEDAAAGAAVPLRIATPTGASEVTVRLPAGVADGTTVHTTVAGAPLLISVSLEPHPVFTRLGDDLHCTVRVPFDTLVLGGTVEVPTLSVPTTVRVPEATKPGSRLRVAGRGAGSPEHPGDLYARLELELADPGHEAARAAARRLRDDPPPTGTQARRSSRHPSD